MSFGRFQQDSKGGHLSAVSDINVTPMVDVMLVLLVIFIIAAPMILPMIPIELPKTHAQAAAQPPLPVIHLGLDVNGDIYWEKQKISAAELDSRLAQAARRQPEPDLQLRADKATRYDAIAGLMAAAQKQGLTKISFVTESASD